MCNDTFLPLNVHEMIITVKEMTNSLMKQDNHSFLVM